MKLIIAAFISLLYMGSAAADPALDAKMKGYQQNLNSGVDALMAGAAQSQKGTDAEVKKLQSFWNEFGEYKNAPVPAEDKYRNTTYDNPVIYK